MRLVHIADAHLGYRAYNKVNSFGINAREADVLAAFHEALDQTVKIKPDLILIAGDLFHAVRPSNLIIYDSYRAFRSLRSRTDAPVVIIGGNHDSPRSADAGCILELLTTIDEIHVVHAEPKQLHFPALDVAVYCLPHNALPFKSEFRIAPDPGSKYNILLAHARLEGMEKGFDRYFLTRDDVREEEWDYVAYGHLHSFHRVRSNAYHPGSIEFAGGLTVWEQFEKDPKKGFIEYDLESGRMERHHVKTREIVPPLGIDANGLTASEVDERIQSAIAGVPGGVSNKIVRLAVQNLPRAIRGDLDYSKIREVRAEALHFELDFPKPPDQSTLAQDGPARPLEQEWEEFGGSYPLPAGVARDRLLELGRQYLLAAQSWEDQ